MAYPDRGVHNPDFEDDLMIDYPQAEEGQRGRPMIILLAIAVVLAFVGVVWVAYQQGLASAQRGEPPVLAQEPGPARISPPAEVAAAGTAAPDSPMLDGIGSRAQPAETSDPTLLPPPEEPQAIAAAPAAVPPPAATGDGLTTAPPVAEPAPGLPPADMVAPDLPAPDVTVAPVRPAAPPAAPPAARIPAEITGDTLAAARPAAPPAAPAAVDPLTAPVGAKPQFTGQATDAARKAEQDRIAREAAKAEAARKAAEQAQLAQLAQAQPPAAAPPLAAQPPAIKPPAIKPPAATPPAARAEPPAVSTRIDEDAIPPAPALSSPAAPAATAGARPEAGGAPILLTPPTMDLAPPIARAPQAPAAEPPASAAVPPAPVTAAPAEAPPAAAGVRPGTVASAVVPDGPDAAASAAPGGAFAVQIGAFVSPEDAAASWKRVERAHSGALGGATPEIRQAIVRGSTKYRLWATGYADRGAAANACNRLKAAGQDCIVTAAGPR
jgi:hypothetical protein